jgi:hypothetical protein
VSPVRYELGFYIPEDGILHSHRRENLKSYIGKATILYGSTAFILGRLMFVQQLTAELGSELYTVQRL